MRRAFCAEARPNRLGDCFASLAMTAPCDFDQALIGPREKKGAHQVQFCVNGCVRGSRVTRCRNSDQCGWSWLKRGGDGAPFSQAQCGRALGDATRWRFKRIAASGGYPRYGGAHRVVSADGRLGAECGELVWFERSGGAQTLDLGSWRECFVAGPNHIPRYTAMPPDWDPLWTTDPRDKKTPLGSSSFASR